ncbi:unnamed protein product [Leuciscus chuanchicus]
MRCRTSVGAHLGPGSDLDRPKVKMEIIGQQDYSDEELDDLYWYHFSGSPEENTKNMLDAMYSHNFLNDFLLDEDLHIPLFPTTVLEAKRALRCAYDFDGIVIHIKDMSAIKIQLHYLFVGKLLMPNLQNHWHILKKHLKLQTYRGAGFSALQKTYGTVLVFVDGGHFFNLSVLSAHHTHPGVVFMSENAARANAIVVINTVFNVFSNKIKNLPPEQKQRETILKNNSYNLGRMTILKED